MEGILLILLFYIIILSRKKDIYEYFYPNEIQYSVCQSENGKGETDIGVHDNKISIPQKGIFTSLIESTNEKDYSKYFKSPSCSSVQKLSINRFYGKDIIDYNKNYIPPSINPIEDKYATPSDHYSILYPPIFNDKFTQQYQEKIEQDKRF